MYFRLALAANTVLTLIWVAFGITGRDGGAVLGTVRFQADVILRVTTGVLIMVVVWGLLWYALKRALLRRWCGLSADELRRVFGSRMTRPFELRSLLAAHSERRLRIADMVGRRGRFFFLGLAAYLYVYSRVSAQPTPHFLFLGLQEGVLDAIALNWLMLACYYSDGFMGRVAYGAQTRILDGTLGRANCLVITTLWSAFKFFMVPLGFRLAAVYPPATYATLFGFVWLSYLVGDGLSEIVGQSVGKQRLRVWGIGEVNRKSLEGTGACFLGSFGVCTWLILAAGLGPAWFGLALVVSCSNTLLELFSPRGTDDFTMAMANALLCWGFGALVF